MNTQDLAQSYYGIGWRLQRAGYPLLASDYHYVADLIRKETNPLYQQECNVPQHLVGELRRNLNRGSKYLESDKRNATLHVMAKTLERMH